MTAQETAAFMGHQSRGEFNSARSAFGECGAQGHRKLISRYASGEGVSKVGRGGLTLNT